MTAARFFLALALVWLLGAAFLSLLGLRQRRQPLAYMQPAVDFAIGASLLATIWTLSALLGARTSPWAVYVCTAALALSAVTKRWLCPIQPQPPKRRSPMSRLQLALTALLLLLFAIAAFGAIQFALRTPLFWDGRYIWAFKAKAMYLDGELNRETFSSPARYAHTALDHPLVLPALEAWVYQCLGHIDERYGKLLGIVYWLGIAAALAAYLRRRMAWPLALAVSLLLTQVPALVRHAADGTADVLIAFHFLAAGLLLSDWSESGCRQDALMSALLFGTSALVKCEGIPICLGAALVFSALWWRRRRHTPWPQLAFIYLCLALPVAPWLALRWRWGIYSLLLTSMSLRPWDDLWPRLFVMWGVLWDHFCAWGAWELSWLLIAIGLLAHLAVRSRQSPVSPLWALFLWQFGVYLTVHILDPWPIFWSLACTFNRLLVHLVPLGLAAACASLLRPNR